MTASLSGKEGDEPSLDVTTYFNPVDCRSLGILRTTLSTMAPGSCLKVACNRFQFREISAWMKKFRHEVVSIDDREGRVSLVIRKGGDVP